MSEEHKVKVQFDFILNLTIALACLEFMATTTRIAARESNPQLLPSTERLELNAVAIRPPIHTKHWNNGKYVDRRCKSVFIRRKIIGAVKNRASIAYL